MADADVGGCADDDEPIATTVQYRRGRVTSQRSRHNKSVSGLEQAWYL